MLDLDAVLTASEAARVARVTKQLFNYWRAKGKIVSCGTHRSRPVYRLGDVVDVEAEMRGNSRSSRSPIRWGDGRPRGSVA